MAQVPYNPVPTATPEGSIPKVSVSTPEAAFGGTVARAVEGLGGTLEGAGNELFSRALSIQQLRNETEARDAITQYELNSGTRFEAYRSLTGKDAVDGAEPFRQDIAGMRDQIRAGLSNDAARRMFDASSQGFMSRMVINSAGHAGQEQKNYSKKVAQSQLDAAKQGAGILNVHDPQDVQNFIDKPAGAIDKAMELEGIPLDSPVALNEHFRARSGQIGLAIEQMAKVDAPLSKRFLNANKGNMHDDDLRRAQTNVDHAMATAGAQIISDNTRAGLPAGTDPKVRAQIGNTVTPLQDITKETITDLNARGRKVGVDTSFQRSSVIPVGPDGTIDRTKFAAELQRNPALVERMARMVRGEIPADATREQKIILLETAFNRAHARGHSLEQALKSVTDPVGPGSLSPGADWVKGHGGGYYEGFNGPGGGTYGAHTRQTRDQIEAFSRDVLSPVLAGSNLSDRGFGPMTGNASGRTAANQRQPGYPLGNTGEIIFQEDRVRPLSNGRAIDLVPLDENGNPNPNDEEGQAEIRTAMEKAAEKYNVQLVSIGGHFVIPDAFNLMEAKKRLGKSEEDAVNEAVAQARLEDSENPVYPDIVRNKVIQDFRRDAAVHADGQNRANMTVAGAMVGNYAGGKVPETVEELRALDPEVDKAWKDLDDTRKQQIIRSLSRQKVIHSDMWEWLRFQNMINNTRDRSDFVAMGPQAIIDNKLLSDDHKRQILKAQIAAANAPEGNPMLTRAIGLLRSSIPDNTWTDPVQRQVFGGLLLAELQIYSGKHNVQMPPDEVQKVGARIFRSVTVPGMFWGTNEVPLTEAEPSGEEATKIKNDPRWDRLGRPPTEREISMYWRVQKLEEMAAAEQAKAAGAPVPPAPAPTAQAPVPVQAPARKAQAPAQPGGAFFGGRAKPLTEEELVASEEAASAKRQADADRAARARAGAIGTRPTTATGAKTEAIAGAQARQKAEAEARTAARLRELDREEAAVKENVRSEMNRSRQLQRIEAERKALKNATK